MALLSGMPEDSLVHGLIQRLVEEGAPEKPAEKRVSKLRQQIMGADPTRLRKVG